MRRFTYEEAETALMLGPVEFECNCCGFAHAFRQVRDDDIQHQLRVEDDAREWTDCLLNRVLLGFADASRRTCIGDVCTSLRFLAWHADRVLVEGEEDPEDMCQDIVSSVVELLEDFGYEFIAATVSSDILVARGMLRENLCLENADLYRPLLRASILMIDEREANQRIASLRVDNFLGYPWWYDYGYWRKNGLQQFLIDAAERSPASAERYAQIARAFDDLFAKRERLALQARLLREDVCSAVNPMEAAAWS